MPEVCETFEPLDEERRDAFGVEATKAMMGRRRPVERESSVE